MRSDGLSAFARTLKLPMKTHRVRCWPPLRQALCYALTLTIFFGETRASGASLDPETANPVKQLSLEQLGDVEVTTVSKAPEQVWKTAAAIFVITQADIQRSGVTTIPAALRLAPGVEVARIDSNKWSIGIRGFG